MFQEQFKRYKRAKVDRALGAALHSPQENKKPDRASNSEEAVIKSNDIEEEAVVDDMEHRRQMIDSVLGFDDVVETGDDLPEVPLAVRRSLLDACLMQQL